MENQNNTTQATTPVPGFTRKTVLRPKTESSVPETKKEPIQEADSDFTEAGNIIANNGEELHNDIADALYELDINGSSRPDIVSAVMRGFLLRNKKRLLQLRRARKSFFETI